MVVTYSVPGLDFEDPVFAYCSGRTIGSLASSSGFYSPFASISIKLVRMSSISIFVHPIKTRDSNSYSSGSF